MLARVVAPQHRHFYLLLLACLVPACTTEGGVDEQGTSTESSGDGDGDGDGDPGDGDGDGDTGPDCTPGAFGCICDNGMCVEGLVCDEGMCTFGGGDGDGDTPMTNDPTEFDCVSTEPITLGEFYANHANQIIYAPVNELAGELALDFWEPGTGSHDLSTPSRSRPPTARTACTSRAPLRPGGRSRAR
jgi:hypothetical protein